MTGAQVFEARVPLSNHLVCLCPIPAHVDVACAACFARLANNLSIAGAGRARWARPQNKPAGQFKHLAVTVEMSGCIFGHFVHSGMEWMQKVSA